MKMVLKKRKLRKEMSLIPKGVFSEFCKPQNKKQSLPSVSFANWGQA